jgi:hypothetical protein
MKQIPCRKSKLYCPFPARPASPDQFPPPHNRAGAARPPSRSGFISPPKAGQGLLGFKSHDRLRFSASAARRKKSFTPIQAVIQPPSLGDKAERARTGRIG